MLKIISIVGVQPKKKGDKVYYKTLAIVEDGDELWGYSTKPDEYKVGDLVMRGFHHKYNEAKMIKKKLDT